MAYQRLNFDEMVVPDVTVVIPTFNSADRLATPLAALSKQSLNATKFEIIVVDNASTDGTSVTACEEAVKCGIHTRDIAFRVVREDEAGLTNARLRGAKEARASVICFLDDDNLPCEEYLQAGIRTLSECVNTALLVSRIYPLYTTTPPPSIARRSHLLAINHTLGDAEIVWASSAGFAPTLGAGMWVRRKPFLNALNHQREKLLSDRKGKELICGGDIEIGFLIGLAGYKRKYVPDLVLKHIIPSARLRFSYFCRLIIAVVRSQATLDRQYLPKSVHRNRAFAIAEMLGAVLAVPAVLTRKDGIREVGFVLIARWAKLLGPYSSRVVT